MRFGRAWADSSRPILRVSRAGKARRPWRPRMAAGSVAVAGRYLAEGQAVAAEKGEREEAGSRVRRSTAFASAFSIVMRIRHLMPGRIQLPGQRDRKFLITTSVWAEAWAGRCEYHACMTERTKHLSL